MSDQANRLRGLMEHRLSQQSTANVAVADEASHARTIAVTSGKGGVGKSVIALNLAIALSRIDARVCLIDANLGLGNVDLLCGLNGYWNLSHVITGARTLDEIALEGPEGIRVISGASGLTDLADCPPAAQQDIARQLQELEQSHDFLIIDTGTGIHNSVRRFVAAADVGLIVTTPEPTAIADAYATVKAFSAGRRPADLSVIVNRSESLSQAHAICERLQQTARVFLKMKISSSGHVPTDHHVVAAVARRVPFVVAHPECAASKAMNQLARRLQQRVSNLPGRTPFFGALPVQSGSTR